MVSTSIEDVQKTTGTPNKPRSEDLFKVMDRGLFLWMGYKTYVDDEGELSEPKAEVTIGNLARKRYANFAATREFFEAYQEHNEAFMAALEKFCTGETKKMEAKVINNLL